jgi:predicted nucleotidyltransferase
VERALPELLAAVLRHRPEVRLALLFGSQARGRADERSDVDLAVDGEAIDVLDLARELSESVGVEVQVVDLAGASYPLLRAALEDGKIVFERDAGSAARWRSRAIAQTETDRPWFERMRDAFLKRLAQGPHG